MKKQTAKIGRERIEFVSKTWEEERRERERQREREGKDGELLEILCKMKHGGKRERGERATVYYFVREVGLIWK